MLVCVDKKGLYEVNPITRAIIYRLPAIESLQTQIFIGSFILSVQAEPVLDCMLVSLLEVYSNKLVRSMRFRNTIADWNALLKDEPLESDVPFQLVEPAEQ